MFRKRRRGSADRGHSPASSRRASIRRACCDASWTRLVPRSSDRSSPGTPCSKGSTRHEERHRDQGTSVSPVRSREYLTRTERTGRGVLALRGQDGGAEAREAGQCTGASASAALRSVGCRLRRSWLQRRWRKTAYCIRGWQLFAVLRRAPYVKRVKGFRSVRIRTAEGCGARRGPTSESAASAGLPRRHGRSPSGLTR